MKKQKPASSQQLPKMMKGPARAPRAGTPASPLKKIPASAPKRPTPVAPFVPLGPMPGVTKPVKGLNTPAAPRKAPSPAKPYGRRKP